MAFTNNVPNFRTLRKPSVAQLMVAVDAMSKVRQELFSEEVEKFVAAACLDEGVYYLPSPLDFAQEWTTPISYKCPECGRIDKDDDNYICDHCGAALPLSAKIQERDIAPIKNKFDKCVSEGENRDELQENEVDIHVAKLIVAQDYMVERRNALAQQIKAVRSD
jgi:DNA-directed RNA polymerase subunit M/transcription elongation factor TFIIS